ncbi:MAG: hypothetical protein Q8755_03115 [Candidatus Phytoplasma australasiaticum]|nr:hypothetical protein [Candidatus Phytoplasma australasiaticum]
MNKEVPKPTGKGMEGNTVPYLVALLAPTKKVVNKRGPQQEEMWEILKQIKINLPFLDAIK